MDTIHKMLLLSGGATLNQQLAAYAPGLWLDSTRGLYTTAAGSTAAEATSDVIGRIEDQSGNARNFTQTTISTPDRRATLTAATYNGRRAIHFDGTDDCYISSVDASTLWATPTVYIVCSRTAAVTRILCETAWRGTMYTVSATSFGLGGSTDPDGNSYRYTITDPGAGLHIFCNRGKAALIVDDTTYTSKSNFSDSIANTVLHLGARNQADSWFDGDICEVLVYPTQHDAATAATIMDILQQKWGTP